MRVKTEGRRQVIIDAALEVFKEVGYERASMAEISARAGGSKATLYNYFKSKEELFSAAMLEAVVEQGLPMLRLDPVLFEQVLFNLLDNEAKYAPPDSEVILQARKAADHVMLTIMDQGEGLPEDELEKVFDKFYRVRASDKKRAGTGLGLAICRGFLEAMGGSISAGNRPGGGAVFTLILPTQNSTQTP